MVKLLIINVNHPALRNRVSDIVMPVTLNTVDGVHVPTYYYGLPFGVMCCFVFFIKHAIDFIM